MVPEDVPRTLTDARVENARLRDEGATLQDENRTLKRRLDEVEQVLEAARRGGKRQAAPFSKCTPKSNPKTPGRRAGTEYGKAGHRQPPTRVEESVFVEVPPVCECGGAVTVIATAEKFQEELPTPRPHVVKFTVEIGQCDWCGGGVQARHPRQTSDALGAAAAQWDPARRR